MARNGLPKYHLLNAFTSVIKNPHNIYDQVRLLIINETKPLIAAFVLSFLSSTAIF